MSNADFIASLNISNSIQPDENVFKSIWNEYERVIIESLITSFGLDFIVQDQYGGDVDTIHNVRKIDTDSKMTYKNTANRDAYSNRDEYDHKNVEGKGTNFQKMKHENRENYQKDNRNTVHDAYEDKKLHFLGNSKNHPTDINANLDHVISAKTIYDDRGRVLSGCSAKDLTDREENLRWTNEHLNKSMLDDEIPDYIDKHPELSDDTKKRMMDAYYQSKASYEKTIEKNYYFNLKNPNCRQFYKDTTIAAGKRGIEMGLRQAIGFVLTEVWFCAKAEIQQIPPHSDLTTMLETVAFGVKKGFESAKEKYKDIIAKFFEGSLSGALASLSTTICNIFFTTAKNVVKCIRQIYASVVAAGRVLLFNPDDLLLGDRLQRSMVLLASGASVLVGTAVGGLIASTPLGEIPVIGTFVVTFVSTMISGLLSCTLLIFLDRSKFINQIISQLNSIPTEVNNYRLIADLFEEYAAKLASIDIEQFKKETKLYSNIATDIEKMSSVQEISSYLISVYQQIGIQLPWNGDFDSFMADKNNKLVFT